MKTAVSSEKCLIVWSSVRGLVVGPKAHLWSSGKQPSCHGVGVGVTEVPGWPQDAGAGVMAEPGSGVLLHSRDCSVL